MEIQLNGSPHQVADDCDLQTLVDVLGLSQRRVAVELNRDIIPRSHYPKTVLKEGDRVEIVHALGGG